MSDESEATDELYLLPLVEVLSKESSKTLQRGIILLCVFVLFKASIESETIGFEYMFCSPCCPRRSGI